MIDGRMIKHRSADHRIGQFSAFQFSVFQVCDFAHLRGNRFVCLASCSQNRNLENSPVKQRVKGFTGQGNYKIKIRNEPVRVFCDHDSRKRTTLFWATISWRAWEANFAVISIARSPQSVVRLSQFSFSALLLCPSVVQTAF